MSLRAQPPQGCASACETPWRTSFLVPQASAVATRLAGCRYAGRAGFKPSMRRANRAPVLIVHAAILKAANSASYHHLASVSVGCWHSTLQFQQVISHALL